MTASADQYLTEAAVLERWPNLSAGELRRARKANPPQIGFYAFPRRRGGPCYTAEQVQEYIDRVYLRVPSSCPKNERPSDSRSESTTSIDPTPSMAESSTPAGMTPELERRAAEALTRQMKEKRGPCLPRSPRQPQRPAKGSRPILVTS